MTETPHSHAATPHPVRRAGPDLLSEMLKAVRLTGAVFLSARMTAPFGVIDPSAYGDRTPMARLRHISILHLIVSGSCNFETAGEQRRVVAGELLFLPFPGPYSFWSGDVASRVRADQILRPGPVEGLWTVDHGGGGDGVRIVCGFIESSEFLFTPVFRTLPPLVVEQTAEDKVGALVASTVREIVALVETATPG
jgi:AraC family transcriptional regulator, alkane utilization regulator